MAETIRNVEDMSPYKLTDEERDALYAVKAECTVCWTNKDGWPVGMPHDFVWHEEKFYVTTTQNRKRVQALRDRPQSCIVVSTAGTDLGGAMVSTKTMATISEDRDLLRWFLPLFLERSALPPGEEERRQQMQLLDSPGRLVIVFEPVEAFSWDGRKLAAAVQGSGFDGWSSGEH